MDKDEQEKRNLFSSQIELNKKESERSKDIKIKPKIYKIKKTNLDNPSNPDLHSSKKNLSQSKTLNDEINNDNKEIMENQKEAKNVFSDNTNIQKSTNKRYNYYLNEEGYEDDEISENNPPKEKPEKINYINHKDLEIKREDLQLSGELNKIMQSSNKKEGKLLKKENAETLGNKEKEISNKRKKEIENIEKTIKRAYIIHKQYIDKSNFFLVLCSLGIILSLLNIIACIFLEFYSNQDVLIIICILSFLCIIIYIFWILLILKDKKYTLNIINSRENPEKIFNSKYRKFILLILYWFLGMANYFLAFMLVNTFYLNNSKLSIKGKAYDVNQWIQIFSDKNYSEIMRLFERSNVFFLTCGWLNWLLMVFIIIYHFCYLFNYRFIRSVLKICCFLAIQGGIYQIYLSLHCYVFRDITSLEGIKISWVTPGTTATGIISILLGFFGYYIFFTEYKKGITLLQISCVIQFFLLLIFTVGLGSIQDKFYNYKKANCNSIFKFVSEDYLMRNKFNGCTSKYLFTTDTIDNMQCPKERIMINWERTENYQTEDKSNKKINNNDINNNIVNSEKKHLFFGCINQSCCLQIYFDIKNKFDLLFILSAHQICFFAILFFISFYIKYKIDENLDEEIPEKINMLVFGIITFLIFLILLPFISTLPKSSNQSKLNLIKNNSVSESLSIIQKENISINLEKLFEATNSSFKEIKEEIKNDFKYNLVFDYLNEDNFKYKLSYYEYNFVTEGMDIMINNNTLKKINFNNFESNFFTNSTEIIKFRTKSNIINNIFDYFNFIPRNPLKPDLLLNIEINAIYSIKKENDKEEEMNNLMNDYTDIIIYGNDIINNYNVKNNLSLVNIIKEEYNFSIMNKTKFFYIKGNIINDTGNSVINIYNYLYSTEPIFSKKSEPNGNFIIGPIFPLLKESTPYHLNIEISKIIEDENLINTEEIDPNSYIYTYDLKYCKYYDLIKVDDYSFQTQQSYSIKNIILPENKKGKMKISGNIIKYNELNDDKYISYVDINLYYGEQINKVLESIELNLNNLYSISFDNSFIDKTSSDKKGEYYFNIFKTGQYMLLFIKEDYYIEKKIFIIDEIIEDSNLEIGTMQLIQLFNSGKIVVKLDWDLKPPDLDLICRFQVTNNLFCYTFFGNKKCGKTEFFIDNIKPEYISSEIIEISELSDYIYLFYVRKYFDKSNGKTQNQFIIEGVEDDIEMNHTEMYTLYDEYLNNTSSHIYIYSNGYKVPAINIPIPDYEVNDYNKNEEYIYWAAFCINGTEGINSLKIINQYMKNEPERNICLSYYDEGKSDNN